MKCMIKNFRSRVEGLSATVLFNRRTCFNLWISGYKITGFISCLLVVFVFAAIAQTEWNQTEQCASTQTLEPKGISLDILGYRTVYTQQYLFRMRDCVSQCSGVIRKVAKDETEINHMGRYRKKQMRITEESRKNAIVIVDERAWDIAKCTQRVKSNKLDGDARFILGNYYILTDRCLEAASLLQGPENARYTLFTIANMYESLAYAYFQLGLKAKQERATEDYFSYVIKEQEAYVAGFEFESKRMQVSLFKYSYALSFIDLGLYLEYISEYENISPISLPRSITVHNHPEAFECALKLLLSFKKPSNSIHEMRAFVYTKLGRMSEARQERMSQGMASKNVLYEQQRTPIREQILGDLDKSTIMSLAYKEKYLSGLNDKYADKSHKVQRRLDSLVDSCSNEVTQQLIAKDPRTTMLILENRQILADEIFKAVKNRFTTEFSVMEIEFIWEKIQKSLLDADCQGVLHQLDKHEKILMQSHRADEVQPLKNKVESIQKEIARKKEEQSRKSSPVATATSAGSSSKKTSSNQTDTKNSGKKISPDSLVKKSTAAATTGTEKNDEIPMHKRVGILIDNLIEKKDYVGAYRGIIAYEKILKANFNPSEIDNNKKELEGFIREEKGDKFLDKLRKELKQ